MTETTSDRKRIPDGGEFSGSVFREDMMIRLACRLACGMHQAWGPRPVPPLFILMYHRIAPRYRSIATPTMNVTPSRFRRQLLGLQSQGLQFWPLKRILSAARQRKPIPRTVAALTFDDGFENNLQLALPILRELEIPATLFLNTAFLGQKTAFPMDAWGKKYCHRVPPEAYRPLTRAGCDELLDSGLVDIGAHTHTHQDFRGRAEEFEQDVTINVELLERYFGITNPVFSFPYGKPLAGFTGDELVAAARRVGVICGLTTESVTVDPAQDPFTWGRFNTYDCDTPATLAAKRAGWFGWLPAQKHRLVRNWTCGTRFGTTGAIR